MATKSSAMRLGAAQRKRQGKLRLAYIGICRALPRRPHWSYDNAARGEKHAAYPWENLQAYVAEAIRAGAAWEDVERFYLELMADAREEFAAVAVGPVSDRDAYLAAIREQCEAVHAATVAEAERSESSRERAIRETQEAIHAGEEYLRRLVLSGRVERPQLVG